MRTRAYLFILLFITIVVPATSFPGDSRISSEERGRQIYRTGISPSGRPIVAYFGKDLLEVPGESATCTSCHGYDGLGRSESGVQPSNITWRHLMKSYGHLHPGGRSHAAFSEQSLISYLQDGIFPGGAAGDPAMPVYDMANDDLRDLISYLRGIGTLTDPGVSERTIRIGLIESPEGGDAVFRTTVAAFFTDVNGKGGVYGRRLVLVPISASANAAKLRREVEHAEVLALIAGSRAADEAASLAETLQIPLFTPSFAERPVNGRYSFALHAGPAQLFQVAIAASLTATLPPGTEVAVIYPRTVGLAEYVAAAEVSIRERGWKPLLLEYEKGRFDADRVVQSLNRQGSAVIVFQGEPEDAAALFGASGMLQQVPHFYAPGTKFDAVLSGLPPSWLGQVWLAYPILPGDVREWGLSEFTAFTVRQHVASDRSAAGLTAYTIAKLLMEALRRSGRDLGRERLVDVMEGIIEMETGFTRPVSFSKNRRIGTLGGHMVRVESTGAGNGAQSVPKGWVQLKQP